MGAANAVNFLPSVWIESLDRVQEADRGDLHEVIHGLAAVHVADRQLPRERHEAFNQFVASGEVALAVVHVEKLFVG